MDRVDSGVQTLASPCRGGELHGMACVASCSLAQPKAWRSQSPARARNKVLYMRVLFWTRNPRQGGWHAFIRHTKAQTRLGVWLYQLLVLALQAQRLLVPAFVRLRKATETSAPVTPEQHCTQRCGLFCWASCVVACPQ